MSKYQYYEFQALDRPLSPRQISELRVISTRARITASSFVNEYQWGDLKADPRTLMARYFDAHLYVANWGSRRLMLRLPRRLVDLARLSPYGRGHGPAIHRTREHAILDFRSDPEDPKGLEFLEAEGRLASLIPLRAEILTGDLRALYVGWLLSLAAGDLGSRSREPPMPPDLHRLSGSLEALIDFLGIDPELVLAAAETHPQHSAKNRKPTARDLRRWIEKLPLSVKNDLLFRLAQGTDPHVAAELVQQYNQSRVGPRRSVEEGPNRRTVGQLLAAVDGWSRRPDGTGRGR